jgi:hypothetical protein
MHLARQNALERKTQDVQASHRIETNGHHSLRSPNVFVFNSLLYEQKTDTTTASLSY